MKIQMSSLEQVFKFTQHFETIWSFFIKQEWFSRKRWEKINIILQYIKWNYVGTNSMTAVTFLEIIVFRVFD